jgi:hypothetical protein
VIIDEVDAMPLLHDTSLHVRDHICLGERENATAKCLAPLSDNGTPMTLDDITQCAHLAFCLLLLLAQLPKVICCDYVMDLPMPKASTSARI